MSKSTEADDVLAARADERLAHAYDQIARADAQLARLTEQLTRMEQDSVEHPIPVMLARRPSRGRPALRAFVGLLAAACIVGAAFVTQSSYGETMRPVIARWAAPYLGSASWLPQAKPELAAQPSPSAVRLASAAEAAPAQAAPAAPPPAQESAPPVADAASSETLQLLQAMARDLAAVQQGVEELKANQERIAGDNARTVEQLKASQEQTARLVARISEQEQRAKLPATPPPPARPIVEPARKPPVASTQARARPLQLQPTER
ncbi:MAG: hypothetical protein GY844_19530 [Bradyrhizobium sp.]|nr:hypothetical protein [Bradyrhizobium sp.]